MIISKSKLYAVYEVCCALYITNDKLFTILDNVHCTMYIVQCTMYRSYLEYVHTLYTILFVDLCTECI